MRIILVTNSAHISDRERDLLTAFLEGKGWSVWHWFKDLWLVDGAPDDVSFTSLRDEIRSFFEAGRHVMIMTTEGKKNHSGWIPTASLPWIEEHWQGMKG